MNGWQGWDIMKMYMTACPVFLIIENIQPHDEEETLKYLKLEYDYRSRIMVVSRCLEVVEKLLGGHRYCYEIQA